MVDSILRPLGAVIGGAMNTWIWTTRRAKLHVMLLAIIPQIIGDKPLTMPQIAGRVVVSTLWPYGPVPYFAMDRALDELVAAGQVIGPIVGDDAEERYSLASATGAATGGATTGGHAT